MEFSQLSLSDAILKAVNIIGFTQTTEIQEKCIPLILEGNDVIGKSQTGSGKTFAYGLPAINKIDVELKAVQVLIVCPTRELASQVCDEIRKITGLMDSIKTVPLFGGSNMDRQIKSLKNNAKIVVGTPGRIMDHLRRKSLKLQDLKMVVLDEADEMLDMGFIGDVETILKATNKTHQTVMFSATMSDEILKLTNQFMKDSKFVEIGSKLQTVDTIKQYYAYHDKMEAILEVIEKFNPYIGMVFCNTIKMTEKLTAFLKKNDVSCLCLNGDMPQSARKRTMTDFKNNKARLLVGTDVAARGLDIKNIDIVINYDLPNDVEYYIHRIGRTGRAGSDGIAVNLISTNYQKEQLDEFEKGTHQTIEQFLIKNDVPFTKKEKSNSTKKQRINTSPTARRENMEKRFGKSGHFNRFNHNDKKFNNNNKKYYNNNFKDNNSFSKIKKESNEEIDNGFYENKKNDSFIKNTKKPFAMNERKNKKYLPSNRTFNKNKSERNFEKDINTNEFKTNSYGKKRYDKAKNDDNSFSKFKKRSENFKKNSEFSNNGDFKKPHKYAPKRNHYGNSSNKKFGDKNKSFSHNRFNKYDTKKVK